MEKLVSTDSNLRRLAEKQAAVVNFSFEGRRVEARATDSVAAAVLATGDRTTRTTPVSGSPRGPFCMMGVCFDCLLEIDGVPNVQSCMVTVKQDMVVRRMRGARAIPTIADTKEPVNG